VVWWRNDRRWAEREDVGLTQGQVGGRLLVGWATVRSVVAVL